MGPYARVIRVFLLLHVFSKAQHTTLTFVAGHAARIANGIAFRAYVCSLSCLSNTCSLSIPWSALISWPSSEVVPAKPYNRTDLHSKAREMTA